MSVGVDKRWAYYALELSLHLFASYLLYDALFYAEITIHWLELVAQYNGSRKKDLALRANCATPVSRVFQVGTILLVGTISLFCHAPLSDLIRQVHLVHS